MHPELIKALAWWREARPCKTVENVFMQTQCDRWLGEPFRSKMRIMRLLCERAGVKPFGFHGIRHKSAAITFEASGLNSAQILMGHYRATTTDAYVKSAGLYTDQSAILAALGGSEIGQAVGSLLEKEFPQEAATSWGNCNPGLVTQ
jgi:integrase